MDGKRGAPLVLQNVQALKKHRVCESERPQASLQAKLSIMDAWVLHNLSRDKYFRWHSHCSGRLASGSRSWAA